jgi:hypothetical protein
MKYSWEYYISGWVLIFALVDFVGSRAVYGLSLAAKISTGFTQSMTSGTTPHAMVGTPCFMSELAVIIHCLLQSCPSILSK